MQIRRWDVLFAFFMGRTSLPPGFRFHPTDVELVMYYLKRKLMGKKLSYEAISEINIYKFCPWDLPDKSCIRSKDLEWFFFCPREKKYASGARTNRATENGYWKTTGKDRPVIYKERTVGMIKTLVFHSGHAPHGERTDWVMHEYRIVDTDLADAGVPQDAYVLCKVFQKSGPGPKNGAQYGAPFNEEEWDDDAVTVAESLAVDGLASAAIVPSNNPNSSALTNMMVPCSACSCSLTEPGPSTAGLVANETLPDLPGDDDIVSLLDMFTEETSIPTGNDNNEEHDNLNPNGVIEAVPCSDGNDIYSGLGDLGNLVYFTKGGFNMSSIFEAGYALNPMFQGVDTSFLELSDLETPLEFPADAQLEQFAPHTFSTPYNSGENFGNLVYGGNSLDATQHLAPLNQPTAPLEGSLWQGNNINMLQQENSIVGITCQGYSSASNHLDLASTRQPEGIRNIAAQAQIRGSFHYFH